MTEDVQLLRRFAEEHSQEAFTAFVRRHLGWVFQASLRRVGGRNDLAQEVAQQVFITCAQNAAPLARHEAIAAWLYTTIRFAANRVLRAEARKRRYEAAAALMSEITSSGVTDNWEEVRPLIDDVVDRLSQRDRETLFMRFFSGMGFSEIGKALGVGEDGARKRLDRALEKLRMLLARRGITSTAAALGAMLATQASAAAPTGIHAMVAKTALAGATTANGSALGTFLFMNATKTTLIGAGLLGLAGILVVATGEFAVHETKAAYIADSSLKHLESEYGMDQARLRQLERAAQAGDHWLGGAQANTGATRAATAKPSTENHTSSRQSPRADGKAFLAEFQPARAMLTEQFKAQLARKDALFYQMAGLTPAQVAEFESRTVQQWLDSLEVTPTGINPGDFDLPAEELASILGQDGLRAWQTFQRESVSAYFAQSLAMSVKNGAPPLTPGQMTSVMNIVSQNSPEFQSGGQVNPGTVDWTTALAQIHQVMNDDQWQQGQPWLLKTFVDSQLRSDLGSAP